MIDIKKISIETNDDGSREVTVTAVFDRSEDIEESDIAVMAQALDEVNGAVGTRIEPDEPKKPRRTRKKKEPEVEEEEEEEEKKPATRRRRGKAKEPEAEEEEEEKKPTTRRRRGKVKEPKAEEEEEEEEKPVRRRRGKAKEPEEEGITKEDVAKAASEAAVELGSSFTADLIAEFSNDGTLEGIAAEDRQEFIDEINNELDAPEE